jgi:hypothetical protein
MGSESGEPEKNKHAVKHHHCEPLPKIGWNSEHKLRWQFDPGGEQLLLMVMLR